MTTELRTNRVSPRPLSLTPAAAPPYGLSELELDVLLMLRNGLYEGEVAEKLVLPRSVVEEQVRSLVCKMNARSKTEAAIMAIREGIFGPR